MFVRSWLTAHEQIQYGLRVDSLITQLVTRNMNAYFQWDKMDLDYQSKVALMMVYAAYPTNGYRMPSMEYMLALSVGELIAPPSYFMPTEKANHAVKNRLLYYLGNETPMNKGRTMAEFVATHNKWSTEARAEDWSRIEDGVTAEDLLETHGRAYADFLMASNVNEQRLSGIDLFSTAFIAVVKRGTVSEHYLANISKVLEDDLQHTTLISAETINLVYKFYGGHITANNAQMILDGLLSHIPQDALRLRVTLDLAAHSGITAFVTVGRAIIKYPDFPWECLNLLFEGELTNYYNAAVIVNGNRYYGFNKTLGAVRSTHYSSLAYVAKELLIQLNGEVKLKQYAGWLRTPRNVAVVKSMIEAYKTTYMTEIKAGQSGEFPDAEQGVYNKVHTLVTSANFVDMFS